MSEHVLAVLAGPGRVVPVRVAGLALPSDIVVVGMQFSHPPGSPLWLIHLTVSAPSERQLELLTKRLNRLVDVRRVVRLEAEPFVSAHRERQGRRTANL